MFRLLLQALLSRDPEVRYQAAKNIYWKLPIPENFKNRLRNIILTNLGYLNSRRKEAANSIGRKVKIQYEIAGNKRLRQQLGKKPPKNEQWIPVANPRIPEVNRTSGSVRLYAILELLRQSGYRIAFASLAGIEQCMSKQSDQGDVTLKHGQLSELCIEVIYGREQIGEHIANYGYRYNYVFLSFPDVAYELLPTVLAYSMFAKVIFDTVDLHGLRFRREGELKGDEFIHKLADYYYHIEKVCAISADIVIAITDKEKKEILEMVPNANVETIPNIHIVKKSNTQYEDRDGLLFIGHFRHAPNQDAVIYFVNDIFPLILERIPNIKFTILGSDVTDNVRKLASDSVEVVGYVDDPEPYFSSHRVFVAPLRYGAGMKGKIGQSMSLGLPLVTTSIGAEGMKLVNKEHVLINDDIEGFAGAVIDLYEDRELWNLLSKNGATHIEKNYSYSVVGKSLARILGRTSI